jgi:threonine synthase
MMKLSPTPLVALERIGKEYGYDVYAKLESVNPTGSHKDRESLAMIDDMISKNARRAVIASTGNAAISLSAFAPCQGISVDVFVSSTISKERLDLISLFKPKIHLVDGSYEDAVQESERFAETNGLYNSNPGRNRHKILGDAEIGVEISSQLSAPPDCVVVPSNNGTLIAGVWTGIKKRSTPRMIAAVAKESSLMGSISGYHRFEGKEFERTLSESNGEVINITDGEVAEATRELRLEGVFCEPASAASLAALKKLGCRGESVVLLITGSAFKFLESYSKVMGTDVGC